MQDNQYNNQNQYGNANQYNSQNQYGNANQYNNQNQYGNTNQYSNQNQYGNANQYSNQNQYGNPNQYSNQNQYGNLNQSKPQKNQGCLIAVIIAVLVAVIAFIGFIAILFFLVFLFASNDALEDTPSVDMYSTNLDIDELRDFYNAPIGNGNDVITLMVYMIGSDLESISGFATDDLEEMMNAEFGDNVNLIVMTGGALSWNNYFVSSDTCQYWQIKDGSAIPVNEDLGLISMTNTNTLTNFIKDTTIAFPANRYGLIFWDHGGGTMAGFGSDENFPEESLDINEISKSIEYTGVKFDFIGFDACLMGTVETALALESCSDYLIASEELVPGTGWYYTDWLTELGKDTSLSTLELGVQITDDFIEYYNLSYLSTPATLSVIELRQIPHTYSVLCNYFYNASLLLQDNGYHEFSNARNNAKEFGEGDMEQIDVIDFVNQLDIAGSNQVIEAVENSVKYHSNTMSIDDSYGLAIYFPYDYPEYYGYVQQIMQTIGYGKEYTTFFDQFVSAMAGGQMGWQYVYQEDGYDYSDELWYDSDTAEAYCQTFEKNEYDELIIDEKGDGYVLSLSDEQWDNITDIEICVLLDDGEGYMDLGQDNVFEWDEEGNLLIEFDYTWVALDGHIVPFYAEDYIEYDDGSYCTYGIVYAVLNGCDTVEVLVYWDSENPNGYVSGYRKICESNMPMGKGCFSFEEGDTLEWVFDYYDYDLNFEDSYIIGEPYTITDYDIEVSYEDVGDGDTMVYFELTDIYQNVFISEAIIYTDDV